MGVDPHGSSGHPGHGGGTLMRRLRAFSLVDIVITQALPGFLFCAGWAVMYEIYHEDGSYYSTLMQEILSGEGLFPYFVVAAVLMAFPVGMIIDSLREVVGEGWLRIPRTHLRERARRSPLSWMLEIALRPTAWPSDTCSTGTPGRRCSRRPRRPETWRSSSPSSSSGLSSRSFACRGGMSFPGLHHRHPGGRAGHRPRPPGSIRGRAGRIPPRGAGVHLPPRPPRFRLPSTPFLPPPREGRDRPSPGVTR